MGFLTGLLSSGIAKMFSSALMELFLSLATKEVVKEVLVLTAKEAAKHSDNKIDDKIVDIAERAWDAE